MRYRLFISILLVSLGIHHSHAQQNDASTICPLFMAGEVEIGRVDLIDTYLSPWSYGGWNAGINIELMKAFKGNDKHWLWQQLIGGNYGQSRMNSTGAGLAASGGGRYSFAIMHHSRTAIKGLHLYYGGNIGISADAIYNYHGGNNPATVKADCSLALTGMIVYNVSWGRQPFTIRYQPTLPVIGLFSQPEYAQSYYEVWLGNYDNFIHCGTWGNRFDMDNRLTIDIHFSNWALRLGYHNRISTTYTNNNRYQIVTNNFTIGFAGDIISLGRDNHRPVIRALYDMP